MMLYSKLKRTQLNNLHEATGISQKPFDYNASFIKSKKDTIASRKSNLIDKRFSVFSSTYAAGK